MSQTAKTVNWAILVICGLLFTWSAVVCMMGVMVFSGVLAAISFAFECAFLGCAFYALRASESFN